MKKHQTKAAREALDAAFKHTHYTFPTLTIRQARILLECIGVGMSEMRYVDGKYVSSDEWIDLIKSIINVRS